MTIAAQADLLRGSDTQASVGTQRDPLNPEPLGQHVRHIGARYLGDL